MAGKGVRVFPFVPRSARDLEIGDFWAVRLSDGSYGCLQVTDLEERGRVSLVAGVLEWTGDNPPTVTDVRGRRVLEMALMRIEVFTEGGAQILGNVPVEPHTLDSPFRDFDTGAVHHVWGWKAVTGAVERVLSEKR